MDDLHGFFHARIFLIERRAIGNEGQDAAEGAGTAETLHILDVRWK